jgi:hypothetical protein
MRLVSGSFFLLLILCGVCLSTGCSDDSTGPDNKAPTPTDLEHVWSARFGDADSQEGRDVAFDASGNMIVTGILEGTADFGGGALTTAGQEDIFIAKFASDGAHVWSKRFGNAAEQRVYDVTVDASGNVIVTGRFDGTVNFGGGALNSAGSSDIFLAKFGPDGSHIWSMRFGDPLPQEAYGVAPDASGNVIVAGRFYGTVDFGGGPLTSAGQTDVFVAKFSPDGNHAWSKRFGDTSEQHANGAAVDASGNVILTGYLYDGADFGGGTLTSAGRTDVFIVKLGPNGDHIWSQRFGDSDEQNVQEVAVDASGNVAVIGDFEGAVDFGGGALTCVGASDIFVAKFRPDGTHTWSKRFGDSAFQYGYGVAIDHSGNTVITGDFGGTTNFGGEDLTSDGHSRDIFIAKLNPNGAHLWSDGFGDGVEQYAVGVAVDASGNVVVTGFIAGTVDFGGDTLTSAGSYEYTW